MRNPGWFVLIALGASMVVPRAAAGVTEIVSAPIKAGAGGAICSCANLNKEDLEIVLHLVAPARTRDCRKTLNAGIMFSVEQCLDADLRSAVSCHVERVDGKAASSKDLACSLSAIDAAGNPMSGVPVDKKLKR